MLPSRNLRLVSIPHVAALADATADATAAPWKGRNQENHVLVLVLVLPGPRCGRNSHMSKKPRVIAIWGSTPQSFSILISILDFVPWRPHLRQQKTWGTYLLPTTYYLLPITYLLTNTHLIHHSSLPHPILHPIPIFPPPTKLLYVGYSHQLFLVGGS